MSYADKRVLVTGGTGFIGGRLAERLALEEKAQTRVLVRDWTKATWIARSNVELVVGDVNDPVSMRRAVEGCAVVFHCAAAMATWEQSRQVNIEGTRHLLEAAKDAGVERFVHISTASVHGPNPPESVDEQAPFCRLGDPYIYSKIIAEQLVWQFQRDHDLPVTVIRPTFVWGPRSNQYAVWPIREMKRGRWRLVDDGQGICDAVYVDNLVSALLLAGQRAEAVGEAFIVTDCQPRTWGEFFGRYAQMLGGVSLPSISSHFYTSAPVTRVNSLLDEVLLKWGDTPRHQPARSLIQMQRFVLRRARQNLKAHRTILSPMHILFFAQRFAYNARKVQARLGYVPPVSFDEGMRETEMWLRDQAII